MKRVLHLSTVHGAVRARVCAKCPDRTPGTDADSQPRPCESTCRLFRSLPGLWGLAVRIDPMVGRFGPAMSRAVRRTEATPDGSPARLTRQGGAFIRTLRDLSGN
jgi:hypothetical protein